MFFDLYNLGIISHRTVALTAAGIVVLAAVSVVIRILKVSISLYAFALFYAFVALCFSLLPSRYWLLFYIPLILLFFVSAFSGAYIFSRVYGRGLSAHFENSVKITFVGCSDTVVLLGKSAENLSYTGRAFFSRLVRLHIAGADNPHYVIQRGDLPVVITQSRNMNERVTVNIPVKFIMRGYDTGSSLYCHLGLCYPWCIIVPWKKNITAAMPPISILNASFAALSGNPRMINRIEKPAQTVLPQISRVGTDNFLHLGPYTPGEPLSRVDMKASLRGQEVISKKYARTIDLHRLVAVGYGRRVFASESADRILSEFGTVLSESKSADTQVDAVLFDMTKRCEMILGNEPARILSFSQKIASMRPSHFEEDEFSIIDGLGQRIKNYTHLTIIVAWGGQFDVSRSIEVASLFRAHGAQCEIRIVAGAVLSVLKGGGDNEANEFFRDIMESYCVQARSRGIFLSWLN